MYDLKIFTEDIDAVALDQIYTVMSQSSFAGESVRIMPDVHAGMGCVVGFTSTMKDKVIPSLIGVDIGCGMLTVELGAIDIDYAALDGFIKAHIPAGSKVRKQADGEDLIKNLYCSKQLRHMDRLVGSIGSLGGGNHFIEVDADADGKKYLVIHSGSRNLGMQVASIYKKLAVALCKNAAAAEREELIARLKKQGKVDMIPDALEELTRKYAYKTKIPAELCYLDGAQLEAYMHDMNVCRAFAKRNRKKIADDIVAFLGVKNPDSFETEHNFIGDDNIIRKGAVPAYKGQKLLIPMNMRDGCLVCEGLGNADWNFSAPHGAGRLLSRGEAKQLISVEEFKDAMQGVYTTTACESTLDESPMAYKPAAEIMELIKPTAKLLNVIKPVYNFKAAE